MPFIEDIEVESAPQCPACGDAGASIYPHLRDHTFGAPGTWSMKRCPACTLMWLDPRPTPGDVGKVYRTYYTHGVNAAGSTFQTHVKSTSASRRLLHAITAGIRRVQDAVLAVRFGYTALRKGPFDSAIAWTLGSLPGMFQGASMQVLGLTARERGRILDIGCGNGAFLARMKDLGWDTVGHEMDAVAARFARETFGLTVQEGPLSSVGLAPASFDTITLSHVIEHVHEPAELVEQCLELLKPNGKLIVLTPNTNGFGHRHFAAAWRGLEPPRHLQCFNPATLRACIARTGMCIDRISTPSRMMRAIWYASRLIQRVDRGDKLSNDAFDYLAAYGMQFIESVACHFANEAGEEIMLIATKPVRPETGHP